MIHGRGGFHQPSRQSLHGLSTSTLEYVAEKVDIWSKISEENEEGSDKKETPIGENASPSRRLLLRTFRHPNK